MLQAFSNGELFGGRFGDGLPWVLALHGWRRTHRDFDATLQATPGEAAIDAIALDLPGFGATPPPPDGWGTAKYAEQIAPVLKEMSGQVVILGHSFGAIVATQLAQIAPESVAALVLTGAPFFRPAGQQSAPPWQYRVVRSLARKGLVPKSRLERAREKYGSADYRAANGVMRSVLVARLSENYDELLEKTTVPVELIWGENDTAAPVSVAKHAAAVLPHANVEILSGVDHFTPLHAPDALRQALLRSQP